MSVTTEERARESDEIRAALDQFDASIQKVAGELEAAIRQFGEEVARAARPVQHLLDELQEEQRGEYRDTKRRQR